MPARHRKPTPWRTRFVGAGTVGVLGVAVALPVVAVVDAEGEGSDVVRAQPATARQSDSARAGITRLQAHAVSRSTERELPVDMLAARLVAAENVLEAESDDDVELKKRWTEVNLNLRAKPSDDAKLIRVVDARTKVFATGEARRGWAQLRVGTKDGWVLKQYLAAKKPPAPKPDAPSGNRVLASTKGVTGAPCPDGSAIESNLRTNAIKVYRAACAAFPSITSWGGYRPGDGSDHGAGLAVDIMVSGEAGWAVANWVRGNAGELGVSEVLYAQRIWSVLRSGEGWRPFADRGSVTANHYDHVHVSVYG